MTHQRTGRRTSLPLIGVALVALVACATDDASNGPQSGPSSTGDTLGLDTTTPDTTAAPVTAESATTDTKETTATTVLPGPTTTVAAAPGGHFEPACREQVHERGSSGAQDDPVLDTLNVVGDRPALEIALPLAVSDDQGSSAPLAGATRIPGGLLVTVSSSYFPGGIVAAVDLDGFVRWIRCTPGSYTATLVAPVASRPERALISTSSWDTVAQEWVSVWEVVSLVDGTGLGTIDDVVDEIGLVGAAASNRRLVLARDGVAVFAPGDSHVIDADVDGLLRADLATWTWSTTTVPPEFDGHPAGELQVGLGADGSLLRMGQQLDTQLLVPQSVEVDGTWVTDDALRRSVWGPTVGLTYADGTRLSSWDATGVVRWTSRFTLPNREGFAFTTIGDTVMAVACGPGDGSGACVDERLVGLDAATGRERWSLPGWRIVGPIGDGIAYVTESVDPMAGEQPSEWHVLETGSGRLSDAPTWPGLDTFRTGCCGEGDSQHADVLGGIVVAVSGQTMRVWLPAVVTPPATASVDLG